MPAYSALHTFCLAFLSSLSGPSEMELGLRLGEAPAGRSLWAAETASVKKGRSSMDLVLGFGLGAEVEDEEHADEETEMEVEEEEEEPLQHNLLSLLPVPPQPTSRCSRFSWALETGKNPVDHPGVCSILGITNLGNECFLQKKKKFFLPVSRLAFVDEINCAE